MSRILIADDSVATGEMISTVLQTAGYTVSVVSCGSAIFDDIAIHGFPQLLLLDVVLASEDGRDICRQLKARNTKTKILLLSASSVYLENYTDCMADDALEKPFDINVLLDKVSRLMRLTQ